MRTPAPPRSLMQSAPTPRSWFGTPTLRQQSSKLARPSGVGSSPYRKRGGPEAGISQLRMDLDRFVFLLGGDGEPP
jgi:hypothetical protein